MHPESSQAADNIEKGLVTFILPHKGREEMLAATLASIANQTMETSKIEVIVVTQNTALQPSTTASITEIRHTVVTRPESDTISALRNHGADIAAGEYLAFLDADVQLSANWLECMLDELENHSERALVSAVQRCDNKAPPLEKIRTSLSNAAVDTNVRFLPGRNLLLKRDTFEAAGRFPEHLVTCEDYYFTDKVHEQGKLYYSSKADYVHLGEDKVYREMYRKEIWRGQSNLQSIKGRKIPLSELPSFLVPLWILLFAVSTVICLLSGQWAAFTASLVLTLLPVLLYTIRLHRICSGDVAFADVLKFYLYYFPARIIGTLSGIFTVVRPG